MNRTYEPPYRDIKYCTLVRLIANEFFPDSRMPNDSLMKNNCGIDVRSMQSQTVPGLSSLLTPKGDVYFLVTSLMRVAADSIKVMYEIGMNNARCLIERYVGSSLMKKKSCMRGKVK